MTDIYVLFSVSTVLDWNVKLIKLLKDFPINDEGFWFCSEGFQVRIWISWLLHNGREISFQKSEIDQKKYHEGEAQ